MFLINIEQLRKISAYGDAVYRIPVLELYCSNITKSSELSMFKKENEFFVDVAISKKDPEKSRQLARKIIATCGDPRKLFA